MTRQTAAPPTQSVQVTNIPLPVKVANPPLAVTVISGEQVNAFHEVSDLSNQVNNPVFTIPTGKRLVIEYLSAKGTVPAGNRYQVSTSTTRSCTSSLSLPRGPMGPAGACLRPRKASRPRLVLFPFRRRSWFGWSVICSVPGRRPCSR